MRNLNKPPYSDVLGVLLIGACLILFFYLMYLGRYVSISDDSYSEVYKINGKPPKFEQLDDSVRRVKNNFEQMKFRAESSRTNLANRSGMQGIGLGIMAYSDSSRKNVQKFMVLTDFGLNQNKFNFGNSSEYYYYKGRSYLRISVKEKIKEHRYRISFKDMPVTFRYDIQENKILIPLSGDNQVIIIEAVCYAILGIAIFVFVFGLVLLSKFLIGISKNRIFEEINIRRLFWIAICCFALVLIPRLVSFLVYLFYYKALSVGAIYTKTVSSNDFYFVVFGILFIAMYVAFKRGYSLKQENDLTV